MRRPRALRWLFPTGGRDESGFTLVELLVSLAIETIVFSALAAAFIVVVNGGTAVNENLKRSADARFAAAFIASDARNSSGPGMSLTDNTMCPDATPPVAGTQTVVARFKWNAPTLAGSTTPNSATYVLVAGNLLRRHCETGGPVTDSVLAGSILTAAVTCPPDPDCTSDPTSMTVAISEQPDAVGSAPYNYTLTAAFRQLNGDGPPPPSFAPDSPLILLGGPCTSGTAGVSISGSATLRVYGHTYINTRDGSGCTAMSLTNAGVYQAVATSILQGGTCVALNGLRCPLLQPPYSPAYTDPYASLVPPATTGRPAQSGCSTTAQPGVYASTLSIQGGSTCTLASGVYILQGGLNVANGATLKTATGGVLIYVTGGQFAVAGGASVTITASTTGAWAGMAVWQAATDAQTISFSNAGTIVINGTLYGPNAQLNISGGAQSPVITSIVARTIVLSNSGDLVVGSPSPPLSIGASASPPSTWTVNRAYPTIALIGSGGDGDYIWSVTGMPTGMTLNASTGVVSGTPTVVANRSATVTLSDASSDDPSVQSFTLNIVANPTATTSLSNWTINKTYLDQLTATAGTTPYTWAATNLPTGLTFNASTGAVTGTPTVLGAKSVTVTVTDAAGATDIDVYTVTINAVPTISTTSLPAGEKTAPYLASLAGSSGTAPYTFSAPTLPAGLTLSTDGVISGTVSSTAVTTTVAITLTDAAGATVSKSLSLAVTAAPTISSVTLTNVASGGTAGKIDKGDSIKIIFSKALSVDSLCSAWSTDTANQSLTADNDVGVTVSDGGNSANDTITVDSSSCEFNFGSLNLGVKTYVTGGDAIFGGNGTNKSTITWTVSTKTLLITLGAKSSGGTVATVTTSTPIYTASTAIRDTVGGSLSNSPLTIAAGKKF